MFTDVDILHEYCKNETRFILILRDIMNYIKKKKKKNNNYPVAELCI
jgi:hypothetical protein